MGDVLLSRIIKYLNGTLFYDGYYQFCTFVIANYHRMIEYTFAQVCKESDLDPRTILGFLNYLGFDNYEDFHRKLVADDILRNDQIRARLLSMSYRDLFRLIVQCHAYDPNIKFDENDFVVFFSSTGRSLRDFLAKKSLGHLSKSKTLLITQNQLLENENLSCIKYFFSLPGKFDGISFNYQIMAILDLIRIIYYQEYFVEYTEEALESR